MADMTKFLFLRHLRATRRRTFRHLRNGKLAHDGPGEAFWFRPLTAALSEVPIIEGATRACNHEYAQEHQPATTRPALRP